MIWITRSHVHVDRVACPWLIKRFVDSGAEFVFVAASQVEPVAKELGAVPFDIPGCELGHKGNNCSFDSIIEKYALKDKALLRLAKIVNAADTDRLDSETVSAGLEAIATGFGLLYPDDMENLEIQFKVYDALYAWCRLAVVANEGKA